MIDTIYLECNLASLTSIREAGDDYLVIAKNPDFLGQGFRGIDLDGVALPLGGTFLEFPRLDAAKADADVRDYATTDLNGIIQFSAVVHDYLSSFCALRKLDGYTSRLNGESFKDFVLGDSLEILSALDAGKIKDQLARLPLTDPRHPSNKQSFDPSTDASYESYCREIYGDYLYGAVFQPLKQKVIGQHDIACLKYHRANWLPLYWPDSILKMLETGEDLKPYSFYRFADFNFAQWTRKLCDGVDRDRIITGEAQHVGREGSIFTITLNDGQRLQCRRVVSALNVEQLNKLLNFTSRSYDRGNSIYLAYVRTNAVDTSNMPEAQFILDASNAVYRISRYASHLSIELSSAHLNSFCESDRTRRVASDFTAATGATLEPQAIGYLREFANARVKLSTNNYHYHQALLRTNESLGIELTGSAAGFGVGSIADQLIQGLRLAAQCPAALAV